MSQPNPKIIAGVNALHLKKSYRKKYRNVPVEVEGIKFASKAEARRYVELRILRDTGIIKKLRIQPRYELLVDGIKIGTYVPDFDYYEDEKLKVEDVKGFRTDLFIWKRKHFEAQYKVVLNEITSQKRFKSV